MELFPKQIVNDLNPLQGLGHFLECKSPLQGEKYFCSNCQWCSKPFLSKSLRKTSEGVDLLFKLQL